MYGAPAHSSYGTRRVGELSHLHGCEDPCFESITVSGAEAVQAARMGAYTKVANVSQGQRPVYKRVGPTVMYLYYWQSTAEWRIGGNYTSSSSGVKSTGNGAACPDQATGWQAYTGGVWVSTYPIAVVETDTGNAPATSACGLALRVLQSPASRALYCGFNVSVLSLRWFRRCPMRMRRVARASTPR